MKDFLLRLMGQKEDMILLLDAYLHTKQYSIDNPEPYVESWYPQN